MNLIKDTIHNALMGVPPVRRWASTRISTGTDRNPGNIRVIFDRYRNNVELAGKRVLELGPGHALEVLILCRDVGAAACHGVDIMALSDANRATSEGIDYRIYDGATLPFEDSSLDVILSNSVLEHVRRPAELLADCRRCLAPGGVLFSRIDLRDHYNMRDEERWLDFLQYSDRAWWAMTSNRNAYCNRLRLSDWRQLIDDLGLEVVSLEPRTSEVLARIGPTKPYLKHLSHDDLVTRGVDIKVRKPISS